MPHVSLTTTANPPVSISPTLHEASASNSVVTWTPATTGQAFTFTDVRGLPPLIFTNKQVNNTEIRISDNGQSGYYPYEIVVTSDGVQYTSAPTRPNPTAQSTGPTIHNI